MRRRPKHLGPEHAGVFKDRSVAEAYAHRAPYPDEVYSLLSGLLVDTPRVVLDIGCGTGEIARRLAPEVERIDAIDPSEAMLEVGRALPGGARSNLSWACSTAEEFDYPSTYGLIITAESLGWLDWEIVFPKLRRALSPNGRLVVVARGHSAAWDADTLDGIVPRYSTNRDFVAFDLLGELETHGLFVIQDRLTTQPVPVSQSVDDYIEFWHSRSGFSRERMGEEPAARFDEEVRRLVTPWNSGGMLRFEAIVHLAWGVPRDP